MNEKLSNQIKSKTDILNLLNEHKINVNDALLMLNKFDNNVKINANQETLIEKLIDKTLKEMDVETTFKIMQCLNWKYQFKPVTKTEVIDTIKYLIRTTLLDLFEMCRNSNEKYTSLATGGFECCVWIDDEFDTDEINIKLNFCPISSYIFDTIDLRTL